MTALGLVLCIVIGALVAGGELVARYRAFPGAAIMSMPGVGYIILNAAAAATAFGLVTTFDWDFGLPSGADSRTVILARALIAGLGAMTLLRSSLFTFTQGDATIDAGPNALLSGLRTAVDRAVDQRHAQTLLGADLLDGLSFARDHEALTLLCSTALVNPPVQSAEDLGTLVVELKSWEDVSDEIKLHCYAMKLVEYVGHGVVEGAADRIRNWQLDGRDTGVVEQGATASASSVRASSSGEGETGQRHREEDWHTAGTVARLVESIDGSMRVDLQLLRACALDRVDRFLGSIAFSEVGLQPAELLLGAKSSLSTSVSHVGHRLVRLLQPERSQPLSLVKRHRHPAIPPTIPPLTEWVYAATLYELWRYIEDNNLALSTLGTSIKYRDFWDVRLARAAVLLAEDRVQEALEDFDRALEGIDKSGHGGNELVVVAEKSFDPVLRPLRALLEPELPLNSRIALWNSATDAWSRDAALRPRRLTTTLVPFNAISGDSANIIFTQAPPDVPGFVRAVAESLPPRTTIWNLRTTDFVPTSPAEPPDASLVGELKAYFGETPQDDDNSLPWLPDLRAVLEKPLDDWLMHRPDLNGTSVKSHQEWIRHKPARRYSGASQIDTV